MQNSTPLSFGDFLVTNSASESDDLLAWHAKQRKLDEDVSKRAHAATAHADHASDGASGAAGEDISKHPAADAHTKAYDLHKSAGRLHALYHRKTGNPESEKKAKEHRNLAAYHREHLVALGAIHESAEQFDESFGPTWKDHKPEPMTHVHNTKDNQRVTIAKKHLGNYPESDGWKEVKPGQKPKLHEDSHILKLDIKQPTVTRVEKKPSAVVNDPSKHCPHCDALGKKHHILNHLRESVMVETIEEGASEHPRHTVSVGYDMPNHENRFERFTQRHVDVKVRAPNKDDAIAKAHKHVEKKGHRVLHSHHIGEEPLKEDFGGKFSDFHHWEKEAKARRLTVKRGTHPNGNADSYSRAKDREGNDRGHFDHETRNGHLGEESHKESIGESAESADHGLKNHSSLKPGDKVETWNDYGPRHPLGSKYTAVVAKKDSKYAHLITVHPLHRKGTAGEGKPNTSDSRTVHVGQITR